MDSIGVTNYVYLYVQEHVQQDLHLTNNSVVLRDGYVGTVRVLYQGHARCEMDGMVQIP